MSYYDNPEDYWNSREYDRGWWRGFFVAGGIAIVLMMIVLAVTGL